MTSTVGSKTPFNKSVDQGLECFYDFKGYSFGYGSKKKLEFKKLWFGFRLRSMLIKTYICKQKMYVIHKNKKA